MGKMSIQFQFGFYENHKQLFYFMYVENAQPFTARSPLKNTSKFISYL